MVKAALRWIAAENCGAKQVTKMMLQGTSGISPGLRVPE